MIIARFENITLADLRAAGRGPDRGVRRIPGVPEREALAWSRAYRVPRTPAELRADLLTSHFGGVRASLTGGRRMGEDINIMEFEDRGSGGLYVYGTLLDDGQELEEGQDTGEEVRALASQVYLEVGPDHPLAAALQRTPAPPEPKPDPYAVRSERRLERQTAANAAQTAATYDAMCRKCWTVHRPELACW